MAFVVLNNPQRPTSPHEASKGKARKYHAVIYQKYNALNNMNKKYKITLSGCDDETEMEFEVSESDIELLKKIESKSDEIGGGCKPTLILEEIKPNDTTH